MTNAAEAKAKWDAGNREKWKTQSPYDNPQHKVCRTCLKQVPRIQFGLGKNEKDGLQAHCKPCERARHVKNPARQMLANARSRAKRMGWEFNLEIEDVVVPNVCPVLGIELRVGHNQSPNSPSLDRIDNSRGYVKGNVRVISWRANDLKANATLEEMRAVLADMERIDNENSARK